MRWRNQLNRCNKEKAMQEEIMETKEENAKLKQTIHVLSDALEKSEETEKVEEAEELSELLEQFI